MIYQPHISPQNLTDGFNNLTDRFNAFIHPPKPKAPLIIFYTDNGFNPSSIVVEMNDVVTFQNNSSKEFQPVPYKDPHVIDPLAGIKCIDSPSTGNLDGACKPVSPGGSWSAIFDNSKIFIDALNPSVTGTFISVNRSTVGIPIGCDVSPPC